MKDIDFDELDKAVNSLMATSPSLASPVPSQSEVPTAMQGTPEPVVVMPTVPVEIAPTPSVVQAPSLNVPQAPVAPVVERSAPPAMRRSGRFMDMVHASSDMKPRAETTANSREGLSITPRSATANLTPDVTASESEPVHVSLAQQSMPDPIDMASVEAEPEPVAIVAPVPTVEVEEPTQPDVTTLGSIESPFLSDAKVEKRPLNAGSGESMLDALRDNTLEQVDNVPEPDHADDSSAQIDDENESDEPPISPQVPELSSDLVAIESNETTDMTQAVDTTDAANQVEAPSVPLGPASIAQQYQPQPSTGDQSHAAIYDSSQYPEPLAHPAKSKSGWLWVLWVVLLLGVGAGGAVVLYNLGIIP